MKKIFVMLCALLVITLVVGCAVPKDAEKEPAKEQAKEDIQEQAEENTEAAEEKTTTIEKPTEKQVAEEDEEETPAQTETKQDAAPSKELSPELKELFGKADIKLQSMSYLYAGPTTQNRFLNTYHVKGQYIKIKLYEEDRYVLEGNYDTVYLDAAKQTANATCENKQRCMSGNVDNTGKVFPANYQDYKLKTPYEWIKEVDFAELVGPEVLDGRSVVKIKYFDSSSTTEMWVDQAYGVPTKIVVTHDSGDKDTYQFKDFSANDLSDSDVQVPFEAS